MRTQIRLFRRARGERQGCLEFRERMVRRDRLFKAAILMATATVLIMLVAGTSTGRDAVRWLVVQVPPWAKRQVGLPADRADVDAGWRRKRERDIRQARESLVDLYVTAKPELRTLFDLAGMTPREAVLRWGNFDQTLLLSSRIFEPDEQGRSYRLRPHTRSIWLRRITLLKGPFTLFLVPDTPEIRRAAGTVGAVVVEESAQTTNSWGCRGPEPDPIAALRGIVLGDSFMQGMFIGDDDTPPRCLERYLRQEEKTTVSILNTGHLGYSPEQYYHTLREYAGRIRPDFVIVAVFANDIGEIDDVMRQGKGDWDEAAYWLGEIQQFCRTREILCLITAIPGEGQLRLRRRDGFYPGLVANVCEISPMYFHNPLDDFISENLRLWAESLAQRGGQTESRLYNGQIGDRHFSARGAELWARSIGRRLVLLRAYLRQSELSHRPVPSRRGQPGP